MKIIMQIIITILALTVMAPGHSETINPRDLDCLAKNIYYEAGNESLEGKVAVGIVTLNRVADGRFSSSICGVVKQKTVINRARTIVTKRLVHTKKYYVIDQVHEVTDVHTKLDTTAVCQFSWNCQRVNKIDMSGNRWNESQQVAEELLRGGFNEFQEKYQEVLYFHAITIRPAWRSMKKQVAKIGNHIFYAEK